MKPVSLRVRTGLLLGVVGFVGVLPAAAQERATPAPASQPVSRSTDVTIAVLELENQVPNQPDLGKQVTEALYLMLSGEPGFRLIDRQAVTKAASDLQVPPGLLESDQAARLGKAVGAQVVVCGRVTTMGDSVLLATRLVGADTQKVEGVMSAFKSPAGMGDSVVQLVQRMTARVRLVGPALVGQPDAGSDFRPHLKTLLASRPKLTVAVVISETRAPATQPAANPAAEAEIKTTLRECGLNVKDIKPKEAREAVLGLTKPDATPWPAELAGVDAIIVGEAKSEPLAKVGSMSSCGARVEISLLLRGSGRREMNERDAERDADASDDKAADRALRKAGLVLAQRVLEHLAAMPPSAFPASAPATSPASGPAKK